MILLSFYILGVAIGLTITFGLVVYGAWKDKYNFLRVGLWASFFWPVLVFYMV